LKARGRLATIGRVRGRSDRARLPLLATLAIAATAVAAAGAGAQEPSATAPSATAPTTATAPATTAAAAAETAQIRGYGAILAAGNQAAAAAATGGDPSGHAEGAVGDAAGSASASVDVRASVHEGAEGTVLLSNVSLLGGRVTATSVRMSAVAGVGPDGPRAGITEAVAEGLVVDGAPVAATPGARVEVAGVGALVLFEQVVTGAHVRANALRLEVSEPGAPVAPGATVVLGHLDAQAEAASPPEAPAAPGRDTTAPRPDPPSPAATPPESAPPPPSPPPVLGLPRHEAPFVPVPGGGGYVFPLYGAGGFTDDYGSPRAGTGWHHGNDIFAPTGTPVLAVADGVLSKVGVNTLGGNRLWLTDDAGNAFYFAHLSAYAPASADGARVHAGQVIAFVGNTGQAITTPPHLHFEIHPAGGDSVDPYPYLIAWQNGTEIPRAFIAAAFSTGAAPASGATLVGIERAVDEAPPTEDGLAAATR
jgi:murein DD-endopeptidase MepM/ murein hydrolase activator NlpD